MIIIITINLLYVYNFLYNYLKIHNFEYIIIKFIYIYSHKSDFIDERSIFIHNLRNNFNNFFNLYGNKLRKLRKLKFSLQKT